MSGLVLLDEDIHSLIKPSLRVRAEWNREDDSYSLYFVLRGANGQIMDRPVRVVTDVPLPCLFSNALCREQP